jgi:hypothetical protein
MQRREVSGKLGCKSLYARVDRVIALITSDIDISIYDHLGHVYDYAGTDSIRDKGQVDGNKMGAMTMLD